ncbi:MAG: hypothetical protein IKY64_09270 [Bacteroidaceae bacterium]|nr:hypothetical protein [Bacteroidaceae bacterium]
MRILTVIVIVSTPDQIKEYSFGDLTQMYYPDHNYDSTLRLFRREMHETRGM